MQQQQQQQSKLNYNQKNDECEHSKTNKLIDDDGLLGFQNHHSHHHHHCHHHDHHDHETTSFSYYLSARFIFYVYFCLANYSVIIFVYLFFMYYCFVWFSLAFSLATNYAIDSIDSIGLLFGIPSSFLSSLKLYIF